MRNAKTVLPAIALAVAALDAATPGLTQKMLATYPTLTTDAAVRAAQSALAQCQKQGYTVAVAVTDRGGQPLAMLRDNLAGAHTSLTAINKAYTAVSFRTDTSGIRQLPQVVAVGGGLMVRAKGSLVGAIAVSGAPNGDADDACAKAGIAAISDAIELE
ncbi:MAG: heme-binding protein [Betaproteobacteria bacterium]|nr:MAG: heme-binding protein [Betaproteobacteria bacterium]